MARTGRKVPGVWVVSGFDIGTVLLLLTCLVLAPSSFATKRARFATYEEVAQTWVGLAKDGRSILRLVLNPDGTGWGGQAFLDGELEVFQIPGWSYARGKIRATARQFGSEPLEIETLEGSIFGYAMELTLAGRDWKREVDLRREVDLVGPWNDLKARMGALPHGMP